MREIVYIKSGKEICTDKIVNIYISIHIDTEERWFTTSILSILINSNVFLVSSISMLILK